MEAFLNSNIQFARLFLLTTIMTSVVANEEIYVYGHKYLIISSTKRGLIVEKNNNILIETCSIRRAISGSDSDLLNLYLLTMSHSQYLHSFCRL